MRAALPAATAPRRTARPPRASTPRRVLDPGPPTHPHEERLMPEPGSQGVRPTPGVRERRSPSQNTHRNAALRRVCPLHPAARRPPRWTLAPARPDNCSLHLGRSRLRARMFTSPTPDAHVSDGGRSRLQPGTFTSPTADAHAGHPSPAPPQGETSASFSEHEMVPSGGRGGPGSTTRSSAARDARISP
jgi:hypothetical protein